MVFIQDTLTVGRFYASPSLRQAIEEHPRLSIAAEVPFAFDDANVMTSPWPMA